MSNDTAIRVEGLGKRYRIDHKVRHDTLRDALSHGARGLWSALRLRRAENHAAHEDFWALRDVSFDVKRGEVVGVIGRNGAGKSTLLKVLSRITEPTTGRIELHGRVASLLEVGTGFHPELTGRENIFLNGSILGMSRVEIQSKFDEIVAFAEVEKFLDTPVKRYSSGMYVRLAFAVAAHLEPEILIVDEVLAVGDLQFQQKCLGKMQSISRSEGRTVLFVSHNLGVVQSLCRRCIVLDRGRTVYVGESVEAVAHYSHIGLGKIKTEALGNTDPAVRVDRAEIKYDRTGVSLDIEVTIRSTRERSLAFEIILNTATGVPIGLAAAGTFDSANLLACATGEQKSRWRVQLGHIANGAYFVTAQLVEPMIQVLARHEYSALLDVHRAAIPPAQRVLEQQWQAGAVEFNMQRQ